MTSGSAPVVKVDLKGLHKVNRRLADGSTRLHVYAWRGGPRIEAAWGTAEFHAEWQRLVADRDEVTHYTGTFQAWIIEYQRTPHFRSLRPATREGYIRRIRKIETEFGNLPQAALADSRIRGDMLDWRDRIAARSGPREADYAFAILGTICSWLHDRRRIPENPCLRPGRLYAANRASVVWSDEEIAVLLAHAAPGLALPCLLAIWTGQREGDILGLTWSAYDGAALRFIQSKTGRAMVIPCAAPLRAALDAAKARPRTAVTICTNSRGKPWTLDGFKTSFGKLKATTRIEGRTFHDFRGTAVTHLARAGATVPEIATITGHSLKDVESILDRHYLHRDRGMGESAIAKLEKHRAGTTTVNGGVNGTGSEASESD